jgi:hypothetical protein
MKNRILFITRHDIFQRSGGGLASRAFINALSDIYSDVDVVLPDNCSFDSSINNQLYKVPKRNFLKYINALFGNLHRFKRYVKKFLSLNYNNYMFCVFDGSIVAGDLVDYVNRLNIKTITMHHNYERDYHVDNKSPESFYGIFPYYIIRNEKNAYKKSNINLFLTMQDLNKFLRVYGKCVGNAYNVGCFEPFDIDLPPLRKKNKLSSDSEITLSISGAMNSYQTIDGIKKFHLTYLPKLIERRLKFNIILTGRHPNKTILSIVEKNPDYFVLIPDPDDIFQVVNRGDIFLCPTCIGSGLKLRLMDGLKTGMPILCHEISAKGYNLFYDKPWFKIYTNEESFIEGLKYLIDYIKSTEYDPAIIREEYSKYFGFKQGVNRIKNILNNNEFIN